MAGGKTKSFTTNDWTLFCRFYDLKNNPEYGYCHEVGNSNQYTYTQKTVDLIVAKIAENPAGIIDDLKRSQR